LRVPERGRGGGGGAVLEVIMVAALKTREAVMPTHFLSRQVRGEAGTMTAGTRAAGGP